MISLNRYHFLLYILVLILCFFLSLASFASDRLPTIEEYIRQIVPDYKPLSEEEFLEATREVSDRPFSEDRLAFSMRIKKDWNEPRGGGDNFILGKKLWELGSYYGEPTVHGRSLVEILWSKDIEVLQDAGRKY